MAQCLPNISSQCREYEAAEAKLRQSRDEATVGYRAAEAVGDVKGVEDGSSSLRRALSTFKEYRESLSRDDLLLVHAERILATYRSDDCQGDYLAIPGGVSDVDAMQALNIYHLKRNGGGGDGVISPRYIEWYAAQGASLVRNVSTVREIAIHLEVLETANATRMAQEVLLSAKGMVFADPIEQVVMAAARACLDHSRPPFSSRYLRGSSPGVALRRDTIEGCMIVAVPDIISSGLSAAASGRVVVRPQRP